MKHLDTLILEKAIGKKEAWEVMKQYAAYNQRSKMGQFVPTEETIKLLELYLDGQLQWKELKDALHQGSDNVYYTLLQTAKWLRQESRLHIMDRI